MFCCKIFSHHNHSTSSLKRVLNMYGGHHKDLNPTSHLKKIIEGIAKFHKQFQRNGKKHIELKVKF